MLKRGLIVVLVALWAWSVSYSAKAETIAATPSTSGSAYTALRYSMTTSAGTLFYAPIALAKLDYCLSLGSPWNGYDATNNWCTQPGTHGGAVTFAWSGVTGYCRPGYSLSGADCVPVTTYTCPTGQNWTVSGSSCTRPDCVAPQTRNASTGVCESPACVAKTQATATAWFDVGTDSDGGSKFSCLSGCQAIYQGDSVSKSSLVNGIRHYYRQGSYWFTGSGAVDVCTVSAALPAAPPASVDVPVAHCASNQIEGLINGKLNCWNVPASPGEAPTLAPTSAPVSKETGTTTTNVTTNGAVTTTTTTTTNVGGPTIINTQTCEAGNCTTTTAETSDVDPTEKKPGEVGAGSGAAASGLYVPDASPKTFSGSVTNFKNALAAAPVATAAGGFFSAGTFVGNCSALSVSFNLMGYPITMDATEVFCGATAQQWYGYIAIGLLLIATGIAFAVAIL